MRAKREWQLNDSLKKTRKDLNVKNKLSPLEQSKISTSAWLSKHAKFLVIFGIISGSMSASLLIVNSNLFGLKWFSMKMPRHEQDIASRNRLLLTVGIENVPQIVISVTYALLLTEFDEIVLLALTSSMISVVFSFVSAKLSYPTTYYIYDFKVKLGNDDPYLVNKLKYPRRLAFAITNGLLLGNSSESDFLYVENLYLGIVIYSFLIVTTIKCVGVCALVFMSSP